MRGKHRMSDRWLTSRQGLQEFDDRVCFAVVELCAQLRSFHDFNGLLKVPYLTRVKIGSRKGDVSQGRSFENILVTCGLCNGKVALVGRRQDLVAGGSTTPKVKYPEPPHSVFLKRKCVRLCFIWWVPTRERLCPSRITRRISPVWFGLRSAPQRGHHPGLRRRSDQVSESFPYRL